MAKIAYNACFGGFGLSDAATLRYAQLAGITLEKRTNTRGISWFVYDGEYFDAARIDREDPYLIQVIEELGPAANGQYASLAIHEIPNGALYRIDEYAGNESVIPQPQMQYEHEWRKAGR